MKSDRSNLFPKLEFGNDNRIDGNYDMATTHTSEKGIMVALGFVISLLLLSGVQLYRCVNFNSTSPQTTKSNRALFLNTKRFTTKNFEKEVHLQEFESLANLEKTEMSIIQNAVSKGKF